MTRNRLTDLQPLAETEASVFWEAGWRDCDRLLMWPGGFSLQMMGALREAAASRLRDAQNQHDYRRGFVARVHQQPTLEASEDARMDGPDGCDDCGPFWL